jgi:hypothetical protein
MPVATFDARVINGRLQYQAPLDALEGQQVRVMLDILAPQDSKSLPPPSSDEPPEDMDVEKDVYVKMPFASEVLKDAVVIEGGPMEPCIILPEELPDD